MGLKREARATIDANPGYYAQVLRTMQGEPTAYRFGCDELDAAGYAEELPFSRYQITPRGRRWLREQELGARMFPENVQFAADALAGKPPEDVLVVTLRHL